MDKIWIVLANASRARICARDSVSAPLRELADLVHPQSRQKGSELGFDHPGHVERGVSAGVHGGTDLDPRSDPRLKEHQRFARELAQHINQGVAARQCERLVLVASNPFLGELRAELSPAATAAVWVTAPHDLTGLRGRELSRRVSALLPVAV